MIFMNFINRFIVDNKIQFVYNNNFLETFY